MRVEKQHDAAQETPQNARKHNTADAHSITPTQDPDVTVCGEGRTPSYVRRTDRNISVDHRSPLDDIDLWNQIDLIQISVSNIQLVLPGGSSINRHDRIPCSTRSLGWTCNIQILHQHLVAAG